MNKEDKILCIVSASVLIAGLRTLFGSTPKLISISLVGIPLIVLYAIYLKNRKEEVFEAQINTKHISLGLLLIITDVAYNWYASNPFGSFDYTIIAAGLFIILLNTGLFRFLKLDKMAIDFSSYFIFICLSLHGAILTGLPFILNTSELFFVDYLAKISLEISTFFLNFIKPCYNTANIINFSGYSVTIGVPCSGVESMTVFFSAAIAYFISIKERNVRKICLYTIVGGVAIFLMNIPRIMAIVLAGYYYGNEAMRIVHYNIGWIMFALAVVVFWYLVVRNN